MTENDCRVADVLGEVCGEEDVHPIPNEEMLDSNEAEAQGDSIPLEEILPVHVLAVEVPDTEGEVELIRD